jgi:hypothetical protein
MTYRIPRLVLCGADLPLALERALVQVAVFEFGRHLACGECAEERARKVGVVAVYGGEFGEEEGRWGRTRRGQGWLRIEWGVGGSVEAVVGGDGEVGGRC